jgi:hypothetical protein
MEDQEIVERVGNNKSKKTKVGNYTPSDPIKTTSKPTSSKMSYNFSKQQDDSPCLDKKQELTVIMAVMMVEEQSHHSSKKSPLKKLVRVLLDTGSGGDLMFHKK